MSAGPIVRLRGIRKRYGAQEVLRGVDLDVRAGETVSIIGPSGSGKSTLLRLIMTLDRPDAGRIEIDGESPWPERARGMSGRNAGMALRRVRGKVGMVFQHFNLFPHLSVLGNVMEAPLRVLGLPSDQAQACAQRYLAAVGMTDKADAYPAVLSGGQRQRVAIARALAMQPKVMLFDEITSALDPELVGGILAL
jgi:polar amino acid transport system ATP-binding protein